MAAGTPPELFDDVIELLVQNGDIKIWRAKEILEDMYKKPVEEEVYEKEKVEKQLPAGCGKVILLGEHSVVYGSHAIAAPISLAMQAKVWDSDNGTHLLIPRWGVEEKIQPGADHKYSIYKSLDMIFEKLKLQKKSMKIEVIPHVPRAMGLGGSAALAVAIIRALDAHFNLQLSDEEVNRLAYESEMLAHGNASGIDNTLATYGIFTLFKRGNPPELKELVIKKPIPIVIGLSGIESLTAKMVSLVKKAWENNKSLYKRIFKEIDGLVMQAVASIENHDLEQLGELMNVNQGLLNALQVSSRELEDLIEIARRNGALGAKLTGAGGGGAMVAICPDGAEKIAFAMRKAGYKAFVTEIGKTDHS
jgi:hydroxymethylglutaryl-CoA reductase